jgi:hypothetical protein
MEIVFNIIYLVRVFYFNSPRNFWTDLVRRVHDNRVHGLNKRYLFQMH